MENLDLEEKINLVRRQTNYTYEESKSKLIENNYDPIVVVKQYIGVKDKNILDYKTKSLNQEIYRQLRDKLNTGIKDYNIKVQNEKVVLH